ncbi:hypothetical protein [Sediminibacter sp. Hel_I_10]|uniref:hypothetical protein n=1 Tax=Sediminibacter sp. Hel_I_10 TaxID=1392490 RepID=UPI00047C87B3|nr:hypothetical protein [Sediminibacter sp. Hel_I_10]
MKKEAPKLPKELSDCSYLETIERLSSVNYSYDEMAIYLSQSKSKFRIKATTEDSDEWLAIQRGRLESQFEIDDKLSQNARTGNITAAQTIEKRRKIKDFENYKSQVYGGTI